MVSHDRPSKQSNVDLQNNTSMVYNYTGEGTGQLNRIATQVNGGVHYITGTFTAMQLYGHDYRGTSITIIKMVQSRTVCCV